MLNIKKKTERKNTKQRKRTATVESSFAVLCRFAREGIPDIKDECFFKFLIEI